MLIYDRRRCRPPEAQQVRGRLSLAQRAKLLWLEQKGWRLLFVRGESNAAFLSHETDGQAMLARDGRMIAVRSLATRPDDAPLLPRVAADARDDARAA